MRCSTAATLTALSFLSGAKAIIDSITAPSIIAPGQPFTITLNPANYIQSVYNVPAAFGIAPATGYQESLGTVLDSKYLGPNKSNILTPISYTLTLDPTTQTGPAVLTAAVFDLIGAVAEPWTSLYNVSVTVGYEGNPIAVTSESHL